MLNLQRIRNFAVLVSLLGCLACGSDKSDSYRIFTAGIAHESNSFNPYPTNEKTFRLNRGYEATEGRAWAQVFESEGMEIIPSLHAGAGPSGLVERKTYEAFRDEILRDLGEAMPVEGIFLDMHGALHVEGYEDAQVDFIQKIREIAGDKVLISEVEGLMDASIFVGMPWTDVYRAGMSVQVVAESQEYFSLALEKAQAMAREIWKKRRDLRFDVPTASIDEAIKQVLAKDSTVFITDSGDNITAGAAGDGTLVLERLMAHQVEDAVLAAIVDPESVDKCMEAGEGAEINLFVGGKIDTLFSKPVEVEGKVLRIVRPNNNGQETAAVLEVDGITLVLLNWHMAFTDPSHFRGVDIDPLAHKIIVVKEGYLFQGLRDIAPHAIMALTPGFANQMMTNLEYHNVRRPIYPLDPDMSWSAEQYTY